jgi:hypothetical protein
VSQKVSNIAKMKLWELERIELEPDPVKRAKLREEWRKKLFAAYSNKGKK